MIALKAFLLRTSGPLVDNLLSSKIVSAGLVHHFSSLTTVHGLGEGGCFPNSH